MKDGVFNRDNTVCQSPPPPPKLQLVWYSQIMQTLYHRYSLFRMQHRGVCVVGLIEQGQSITCHLQLPLHRTGHPLLLTPRSQPTLGGSGHIPPPTVMGSSHGGLLLIPAAPPHRNMDTERRTMWKQSEYKETEGRRTKIKMIINNNLYSKFLINAEWMWLIVHENVTWRNLKLKSLEIERLKMDCEYQ